MKKSINQTVILIPAYDPDRRFPRFLEQLTERGFSEIIVVNDGSREDTARYFSQAEAMGCHVVTHACNRGYGAATKTGLEWFRRNFLSGEKRPIGVITCDCDGQHDVTDILTCEEMLRDNPDVLVWGLRDFSRRDIPWKSAIGNRATTAVFRRLIGLDLPDTQSGLRGIPTSRIDDLITAPGDGFEFTTSLLLEARRNRVPLVTFPVQTIYLDENRSTHFRPVRDSVRVYATIGKYLLKRGRRLGG